MGRRSRKKSNTSRSQKMEAAVPSEPLNMQIVHAILGLPRLARIFIAVIFALAVAGVVEGIFTRIFFILIYQTELFIAAMIAGSGMYIFGWRLIVGTIGEEVPARLAVLWYVGVGLFAVIMLCLLLLLGYSSGTAVA